MKNVLEPITGVDATLPIGGEELVDIENPTNADPTLESKWPSPKSFRQPPSGWAEFRRRTISKSKAVLREQ